MKSESNFGVAMATLICPVCGKDCDSVILMNQRLTPKAKDEVEELHGKTIGYSDKPCSDCKEILEEKDILIEVDLSKTNDKSNPYRTGRLILVEKGTVASQIAFVDKEQVKIK